MAKLEIGRDALCPECKGDGGRYKNRGKPDEQYFPCAICDGSGFVKNTERPIASRKV